MSSSGDSSDVEWKLSKTKGKDKKENLSSSYSKQKYPQRFCQKWMNLFSPWLARCEDDPNKPFCRACQTRLDCNRCHLQRHEQTTKHLRNLEILVSKGEAAARQNLTIRQERSKYYQQRKKLLQQSQFEHLEEYIDDSNAENETSFQFVPADNSSHQHFNEETILKSEIEIDEGSRTFIDRNITVRTDNLKKVVVPSSDNISTKKERIKLLMQIQKDKNDLMETFRDLVGGSNGGIQTSPKERNHVDLFFDSVGSSVKALTPKLIAEAKMRVSQLICELELRAITEGDNSSSNTQNATVATPVLLTEPTNGNTSFIISQPVTTVMHSEEEQQYETIG